MTSAVSEPELEPELDPSLTAGTIVGLACTRAALVANNLTRRLLKPEGFFGIQPQEKG